MSLADLAGLVAAAHRESAVNNENASSLAVRVVASCGGTFQQAAASAILTLGETHGPTRQARRVIFGDLNPEVEAALERGEIIPGWGNAFFGSEGDPAWKPVSDHLRQHFEAEWFAMDDITERIRAYSGLALSPNAAAYTATLAELSSVPVGTEISLAVSARMPAWAAIYSEAFRDGRLLGSKP